MIVRQCDLCKRIIENDYDYKTFVLPMYDYKDTINKNMVNAMTGIFKIDKFKTGIINAKPVDLCIKCAIEIADFLESKYSFKNYTY